MKLSRISELFRFSDHPNILVSGKNFARKYITDEELIELVENFFKNYYPLGERRKVILSFSDIVPDAREYGGTDRFGEAIYEEETLPSGEKVIYGIAKFYMRNIDKHGYIEFLNTLFHELTHILQYFRRDRRSNTSIEYKKRPWEIEANFHAHRWTERVSGFPSTTSVVKEMERLNNESAATLDKVRKLQNSRFRMFKARTIDKLLQQVRETTQKSVELAQLVDTKETEEPNNPGHALHKALHKATKHI